MFFIRNIDNIPLNIEDFENSLSPYYITINNNIKIIRGLVETFSLVRLKNSYVCGFQNEENVKKYSGELIDVFYHMTQ